MREGGTHTQKLLRQILDPQHDPAKAAARPAMGATSTERIRAELCKGVMAAEEPSGLNSAKGSWPWKNLAVRGATSSSAAAGTVAAGAVEVAGAAGDAAVPTAGTVLAAAAETDVSIGSDVR
eukprot:CAMPEP_0115091860 /NCGR_PEP_ID=MMETSP0227-20121206/26377_1 /TAXON_ID=89957 /ORGANISM="Polarella glacialis, Strain CCMP 1383" /LENGTH=121 /DNA_ID=CAMNT_0002483479 /DNA_START=594 /DNA_END=955 /DNA_ORIENTATION=+